MGLDEATVQAAIDATAARLGVTRGTGATFVPDQTDRDSAYPFWRLDAGVLHYLARERGQILFDRTTTSLDQLLEWVFADVTRGLAGAWELAHRRAGEDSRRQLFARWIELAGSLSPDWGLRVSEHVDEVLRAAPYDDTR